MDSIKAVSALGALAQEHRLALFRLLVQAGRTACRPARSPRRSASPIRRSPFTSRSSPRRTDPAGAPAPLAHLSADYAAMNALVGYLMENCCAGAACGADAACDRARSSEKEIRMKRLHVHVGVDDLDQLDRLLFHPVRRRADAW